MRFNYSAADAKSHANAVGLGGNKRIEDLVLLLRWQPHPRVADGHLKLLVIRPLRLDGKLTRSIPLFIASMLLIMRFN
jgi:hypothetical protein